MDRAAEQAEFRAASRPVEDKFFVAVAEENGGSNLLWAIQNLAKDGATIVIAHVHRHSRVAIPAVGIKSGSTTTDSNKGRPKAEKKLAEYAMMCKRRKISCQELIIEKDDVAKGLEELIAHCGIAKLVVGAAADERFSNALFSWSRPWSKIALRLMDSASNSCKIWFTCKGHLVCTRQGGRNIFATPPSPTEQVLAALHEAKLNLLCAMKKTEDWKMLHPHEIKKSQAAQKLLLRERQKVQEIQGQLEVVSSELDDAQELKQQIAELNRARKAQEEQLAASKCILELLEADNLELRHERDAALTEAEDLRWKSRLSASDDDASAPSYFVCPIYQDVMEDPHIAADGFTYEGEAIRAWINGGRDTSPMTNLRLAHKELTPNRALRSAILEWGQRRRRQQHRWKWPVCSRSDSVA